MDKRPQRLAKNKTDLMPKNTSCKRWDTPIILDQHQRDASSLMGGAVCAGCVFERIGSPKAFFARAFNMCGDVAAPNLYAVAQQNCLQAPDTRMTVMGPNRAKRLFTSVRK
jgi:hypothetical protein